MTHIESSPKGHVAVFLFPSSSQPFALFNFAQKLARSAPDVQFSIFNTAQANRSIISRHQPQNTNYLPINIRTYDVEDGMPEGYYDHRHDMVNNKDPFSILFLETRFFIKTLPGNFERGMDMAVHETGRKISCILTDAMFSFTVGKMAKDMNVPWLAFWVPAPYDLSVYLHVDVIRHLYMKNNNIDQTLELVPGLSAMRLADLSSHILTPGGPNSADLSTMTEALRVMLPEASAVVMNSFEELNPILLTNDLRSKFQNLLYVGLPSLVIPPPQVPSSSSDPTGCLSWLDERKSRSVAYISFGTVAVLTQQELLALAEALESSGLPFLWSLKDDLKGNLQDGFVQRVRKQGMMVPWAPQIQVLMHPAIGVYVTHCGYNSVFESILGEVPMICRPIWADNHLNVRMVDEVWGIGVRVEGVITKNGMLKSFETIFQLEKGKKIREAISSLKLVLLKAAGADVNAAKDFNTLVRIISNV